MVVISLLIISLLHSCYNIEMNPPFKAHHFREWLHSSQKSAAKGYYRASSLTKPANINGPCRVIHELNDAVVSISIPMPKKNNIKLGPN